MSKATFKHVGFNTYEPVNKHAWACARIAGHNQFDTTDLRVVRDLGYTPAVWNGRHLTKARI